MKKTNFLFALLYIIGLVVTVYALYQLPISLIEAQVIDLSQLKSVRPVANQLYLLIGVSSSLGAIAFIGLMFMGRKAEVVSTNTLRADQDQANLEQQEDSQVYENDNLLQIKGLDEVIDRVDDAEEAFTKALSLICHHLEASQAAAYQTKRTEEYGYIELFAAFAYHAPEGKAITYRLGEGLAGQVAKQGECVIIDKVPEGYLEILSGLGKSSPTHLIILPIKQVDQVVGVVEIASFKEFSPQQKKGLSAVFDRLAQKLSNNDNVSLQEATS